MDGNQSAVKFIMPVQKGKDSLRRDILATGQSDVRAPRAEVRLEAGSKRGVGHFFVKLEKDRMAAADTYPKHLRAAVRREGA